ncbi:hypothetical protein Q4I32_003707 [Leishmania shawi]|uniref:SET domain-containing protein n=1 Tax=Leishmania shawi TaxID=5680 RepID=A0AAW3BVV9_9TRYP
MPLHPHPLLRATPLPLLHQRLERGPCSGSGSLWILWWLPLQRRCEAHVRVQRRAFATCSMPRSWSSLAPPSSSPSLLSATVQATGVVTRLGPSERLPGLRGVFLTEPIKKFHPIEVLPTAASAAASTTTAATVGGSAEQSNVPRNPASEFSTQAPPLVLNLAFAPRHSISLRRFLALRHMFSTSAYLHVATEDGWYLVAPSSAAPLCDDVPGLQAWCCRHHHRYLKHPAPFSRASTSSSGLSSRVAHPRRRTEIDKLEAALDNGEELSEKQLQRLAAQEKASFAQRPEHEGEDGEDDNPAVDEPRHQASREGVAPAEEILGERTDGAPALAFGLPPPPLRTSPPLITEAHLFDINDGVAWPLPPSDDLANHEYWKGHRQRMALYESTGDADAAVQREALLAALRADLEITQRLLSEQELYAAAEELFQTLKHKANVTLNVDAETGLLTLVPLRDLRAGEELLLHYGREWWTGRLLFSLLLSVSDAAMPQIRWIEQLFESAVDANEPFPLLISAHEQRKRLRRGGAGSKTARRGLKSKSGSDGGKSQQQPTSSAALAQPHHSCVATSSTTTTTAGPLVSQPKSGRVVLYNTVTRKRATDAAVLAFAVRRSCTDLNFWNRLLLGDVASGLEPVFHLSEPDSEVPMRVLRHALLASLRGVTAVTQSSVSCEDRGAPIVARSAVTNTTAGAAEQNVPPHMTAGACGDGDDDDDVVFSV